MLYNRFHKKKRMKANIDVHWFVLQIKSFLFHVDINPNIYNQNDYTILNIFNNNFYCVF